MPLIGARTVASFELLHRQVVGGAAILQQRLLAAGVVHRGLVGGFGDFQPRLGGLQVDRGNQAARRQRFARSAAARASSRFAIAFLTDPISSSGGAVSPAIERPVHPELRPRLPQRALGARDGQRQLPRFDPDQRVTGADLAADFHQHAADDARRPRR